MGAALDPKGGVYYYHPTTGMSLNQHPLDHHYQQFYMQMKAQYDAMYQQGGGRPSGAPETPGAVGASSLDAAPADEPLTPIEQITSPPAKKKDSSVLCSEGARSSRAHRRRCTS